jgi:hypothetical protein
MYPVCERELSTPTVRRCPIPGVARPEGNWERHGWTGPRTRPRSRAGYHRWGSSTTIHHRSDDTVATVERKHSPPVLVVFHESRCGSTLVVANPHSVVGRGPSPLRIATAHCRPVGVRTVRHLDVQHRLIRDVFYLMGPRHEDAATGSVTKS